ncbi:MAG TPA: phosphate signaling complex protein PhoU [Steroidobacteraceae bacterium]|nr:phosphate signaling complex protein PhoU [Steroidobacteraceae bacterium]
MKPLEGHISRAFDGALGALHLHVITMGSLAVDQVRTAVRAYANWDAAGARTVMERERAINAYDHALDEEQLALLARRQPVASDLRFVIAFSRAVAELERVGDEAKKIARVVLLDEGPPTPPVIRDISDLGQRAEALLRRSLEALDVLDGADAAAIVAADKEVDRQYEEAMERLFTRAAPEPAQFRRVVHAAFVLKSLERIGDHARNLARLLRD